MMACRAVPVSAPTSPSKPGNKGITTYTLNVFFSLRAKKTKKKLKIKQKNSLESAQNPIEQRLAHLIARVGIIERQSDKKLIFDINVVLGARYRIDISLVDALFYVVRVQETSRPSTQAAQHLFSHNFINN